MERAEKCFITQVELNFKRHISSEIFVVPLSATFLHSHIKYIQLQCIGEKFSL